MKMKLSPFFSELASSYAYEIEDLTWDSGGDNVLAARLRVKREQFADLLPMCETYPVMVVPAFRGAFRFVANEALDRLVAGGPEDFGSWPALAAALELEPWAQPLARRALAAPGGEQFMLTAAGLEYIQAGNASPAAQAEEETSGAAAPDEGENADEDEAQDADLAEAGEDYLSEQGFDRRS